MRSDRSLRLLLDHDERQFFHHVGMVRRLFDGDDGLHFEGVLFGGEDLPKVRSMITEAYDGVSVGFRPVRTSVIDGVRWRTQIRLEHIGLTPVPAYTSARLVSMSPTPHLDELESWLANDGRPPAVPTPRLDKVNSWLADVAA